jgi:hypothetical protein
MKKGRKMHYDNIEKSQFRRGEYVGYGRGSTYRIFRSNGPKSWWTATTQGEVITARTLREISAKLAVWTVKLEHATAA